MKNLLIIVALALFLVGCNDEVKSKYTAENTAPPLDESGPLMLAHTGNNGMYECNNREVIIDESATANSYRLTGECKSLSVDGVSNEVKVDKVAKISVTGTSNTVLYRDLIEGEKPEISMDGTSLKVEQIKNSDN